MSNQVYDVYFCKQCSNLTKSKYINGVLTNYCDICDNSESNKIRTFSQRNYDLEKMNKITKYQLIHDNLFPEIKRYCKKCKKEVVMKFYEKDKDNELKRYYVCVECNQFSD